MLRMVQFFSGQFLSSGPLPSSTQRLSNDDCLEDRWGRLSEVVCVVGLLYTTVVHNDTRTDMNSS